MKRRIIALFGLLSLVTIVVFGFNYGIDPTKKSDHPINKIWYPETVHGALLSSPLSTLNESFEGTTFPPAGWTKITPTNAAGWNRQVLGTTPVPGFQGATIFTPPNGGSGLAFCNYITGNANGGSSGECDQWLITPQITNVQANDSLSFWLTKFGNYKDNFIIRISTTTPTVAGMTVLVDSLGLLNTDSGWVQRKYKIGNLVPAGSNIYIGFREYCADVAADGASFWLDLIGVSTTTGINNISSKIPDSYQLNQNYPNPFNPVTKINFSVPKTGLVTLKVYDLLGKEVSTLVNEVTNAGTYSVDFDASSSLTSGIYFYKLESNGFSAVKKMMLVK
jgi:hypothetical protein